MSDLGLIRLGMELPAYDGRNRRMAGRALRVHLVTDVNDDGQTLCGKSVGSFPATKYVPNASGRPWSTAWCDYCFRARRDVERLAAHEARR